MGCRKRTVTHIRMHANNFLALKQRGRSLFTRLWGAGVLFNFRRRVKKQKKTKKKKKKKYKTKKTNKQTPPQKKNNNKKTNKSTPNGGRGSKFHL